MSDNTICTWPSCGHTAKGQCRGAARRIQLFTDDQLAAAVADAVARAERAEAALAAAEEALRLSAVSHRVIAGMDLISASAVAYNAAREAETALAKAAALKGGAA